MNGKLLGTLSLSYMYVLSSIHHLYTEVAVQQYKTATLYFSRDSASIAAVIPAMDTLTNTLNPDTKEAYHPSILAAMKLARKKMDRYYSLTDDSAPYRIAMGKSMTLSYYCVTDYGSQSSTLVSN
jgi:hypothetical protein